MAKNEKRFVIEEILVCKKPKNKDMYKCDCISSPNEMAGLQVCPIHPQVVAEQGISRQDAINQVVKALEEQCMPKSYIEYVAKIAVDAILGVEK